MALYAKITCQPPLGQLTVVKAGDDEVHFTAILESSKALPAFPWELSLCYKTTGKRVRPCKWEELPLKLSSAKPLILNPSRVVSDAMPGDYRSTFTGVLPVGLGRTPTGEMVRGGLSFTVKYRADIHSPWQWVKYNFGTTDGELIIQEPLEEKTDLHSYLQMQPGWTSKRVSARGQDEAVFSLQSQDQIPRGDGIDSKVENKVLGKVQGQSRFFALVRISEPWLGPRHGKHRFFVPEDALLCCFLTENGHTISLLALNGIDDVLTVFKSDDDYNIVVAARNDGKKDAPYRILAAVALTHELSIAAAVSAARELIAESAQQPKTPSRIFDNLEKSAVALQSAFPPLDDWYDGLAYCTYNSLGVDLTPAKILRGLDSLAKNGIKISTLIIDDNWQSIDGKEDDGVWRLHRRWEEFEANKKCFPEGLKAAITQIREKYPHIKDIAVWHALLGYWRGISPKGPLAQEYKTIEVEAQLMGHLTAPMYAVHPDDAHRMYDDFYTFLVSCGITAVKTDVQFLLDGLTSTSARSSFTTTYQSAWTAAYLRHFKARAISCMSMIPQILFHSFLPTGTPRIMLRNSDDFFPEVSSSHPWHLFINAHNVLLTQHLNALPDWDMFQTSHSYSSLHGAARCISGGPLYITDVPGEHDVNLISEMTALTPEGRTIALRPTTLGRTVSAYDNFTDGNVLKIGSFTGTAAEGTAILGLFNISEKEITFLVPLSDFMGISSGAGQDAASKLPSSRSILLRSHRESRIFPPVRMTRPLCSDSLTYAKLPIRGYDILYAHPVHHVGFNSLPASIAVLGLLRKMTGPAAVVSSSVDGVNSGAQVHIKVNLKALGTLGIWISGIEQEELTNQMVVTLRGKKVSQQLLQLRSAAGDEADGDDDDDDDDSNDDDGKSLVLEIDVLKAWSDLESEQAEEDAQTVVCVEILLVCKKSKWPWQKER